LDFTYPSEDYVVHDSELDDSKDKDCDVELAGLVQAFLLLSQVAQETFCAALESLELDFFV